jgi:parvulin-like peptidyl-prolyl isomerase
MMKIRRRCLGIDGLLASVIMALAGCSAHQPKPLAGQFDAPAQLSNSMPAEPFSGADQPGAIQDNAHGMSRPGPAEPSRSARSGAARIEPISPTVQQNVTVPGVRAGEPAGDPPSPLAVPPASSRPASTRSTSQSSIGASSGEYFTLGGVVAEVNNTPIYANKVLKLVEPILSKRARQLSRDAFRLAAEEEISRQIRDLVDRQLLYAAAEQNLDAKDKEIADLMTAQWRNQQINEAGGSIELARARATARGEDFDELVQDQYRANMALRFKQKKLFPRIQITAQEMRQYYDSHLASEFTRHGTARFRLIKIDIAKSGGREPALDRIDGARNRIVKAGEPFDVVAHEVNDDPHLLRTGGDLGAAIQQGAFFSDKIEQSVWKTPIGQVTPVIDTGDAFYIAEVEDRKPPEVDPFEDEQVQIRIQNTLESEQLRTLARQIQDQLLKDAIVRATPQMQEIAVEMAMENYARWSGQS